MTWRAEQIDIETWPEVFPLLAPSLALAGEPVHQLIDLLISQRNILWVNREGGDPIAAAVSEDEGDALCVRLFGGKDMARWVGDAVNTIRLAANGKTVRVEVI